MFLMLLYLVLVVAVGAAVAFMRTKRSVRNAASLFYILQAGMAVAVSTVYAGAQDSLFFTFDKLGVLFFLLMTVVSSVAFYQSNRYLDTENVRHFKIYHISMIALCASAAAVYFAGNIAVTWVFLEATTLSTAGIVYHRRKERSLEATWKYIFVCSTGLAVAYLGILLMSTVAVDGNISYAGLAQAVADGNPLYLKIAFLLILVGYSCKLEIFPLYTIGIDANFAAPTPASAVISTVLVNAGFVSLFRVYKVVMASGIAQWASYVLIIVGLISVLVGAVFLRRTNNYKRFMSYSTVENMGIVAVGLGVGGIALFAVIFHAIAHTLIKSGLFFNIAQIGKLYGTYRINRIGNYIKVNKVGVISVILGLISLLAFPPSAFFVSELLIFKQMIAGGQWWLLAIMVLAMCFVMYSLCFRMLTLCYRPVDVSGIDRSKVSLLITWTGLALIALSVVMGVWQPEFFVDYINGIING